LTIPAQVDAAAKTLIKNFFYNPLILLYGGPILVTDSSFCGRHKYIG